MHSNVREHVNTGSRVAFSLILCTFTCRQLLARRLQRPKTKTCTGLISRESPRPNAQMKISAGPQALHRGHCSSEEEMQKTSFTVHHVYVTDKDILCTRINVFWTLGWHYTSIIKTCCAFLWLFRYFGVHCYDIIPLGGSLSICETP